LPFAALKNPDPAGGRYVIEDASVALSGSTILYLYSLARSRELASIAAPSILLVGDPAFDRDSAVTEGLKRLEFAYREVAKIAPLYGESEPLLRGDAATAGQFFQLARSRNVIHVAAHAITNEDDPSSSMILFAKTQQHRGLVTAAELMKNLDLTQTRLVVLSTCSSTGGFPVGKNGVAPLVRPLLAERVPAVIGTLWDIDDATAAELMVSFHRHYRKSNDVTEALAQAQRDLLKNYPAYTWAPFQVIGH
ncbi:MAG TPA: CHAT domain-containing protein, partial [Thermoanaerobaculia bacterium]|nr:CHAT domain-containing protein [Thermoanaerobaculia bacterium]